MTGATDRDGGGAGPGRWRRILARRSQALDSFAVAGRNPQLRLMLIARLATVTGRWASAVALAVYAYDAGGATYVGVLAKVFSVLQSCFVVSIGLGAALAPVLVAWIGIRGALLASGAVLPVLVILLWSRLVPLDTSELQSEEVVNLLRSLPIFAPLELPALERLARAVVGVAAEAGETVIAEGEHGDRYYAIRDGEFEVSIAGEIVSRLGPGEGFGEIALLRDVPCTATVTARSAARLYALEREQFLEAVSQSPPSADAAENVIDMRLGSLRAGLATL